MSNTHKENDFRKLRKTGKRIKCLFNPAPIRKRLGKSLHTSEEGTRIFLTYTEKELYHMVHRRHSAAHRKTSMRTKNRCKRIQKHRESREAMKDQLTGE